MNEIDKIHEFLRELKAKELYFECYVYKGIGYQIVLMLRVPKTPTWADLNAPPTETTLLTRDYSDGDYICIGSGQWYEISKPANYAVLCKESLASIENYRFFCHEFVAKYSLRPVESEIGFELLSGWGDKPPLVIRPHQII